MDHTGTYPVYSKLGEVKMQVETQHHIATELLKASPPVVITSMSFLGVELSQWAILMTLIYTIAMLGFLFRDKVWREYIQPKRGRRHFRHPDDPNQEVDLIEVPEQKKNGH